MAVLGKKNPRKTKITIEKQKAQYISYLKYSQKIAQSKKHDVKLSIVKL